jgi:hypothetical protein
LTLKIFRYLDSTGSWGFGGFLQFWLNGKKSNQIWL